MLIENICQIRKMCAWTFLSQFPTKHVVISNGACHTVIERVKHRSTDDPTESSNVLSIQHRPHAAQTRWWTIQLDESHGGRTRREQATDCVKSALPLLCIQVQWKCEVKHDVLMPHLK